MKKFLSLFIVCGLLCACSEKKDASDETEQVVETKKISLNTMPSIDYAKKTFSFSKNDLKEGCEEDSEIVCAINLALKCSINPLLKECEKDKLPSFIFMEDESLERPTQISYKILKMKPIAGGSVEIYTQGTCDASWFGLCEGNIIYVMSQEQDNWFVKDIYARTGTIQ